MPSPSQMWPRSRRLHLAQIDEVNRVHGRWCMTPGPEFVEHLMVDEFKVKLQVDNAEILDRFREGPFITVSNHPFGSLDGIALIYIVTRVRPEYKVMVNMILNQLSAMRPNFIAVDQSASSDPEKRRVSVGGIKEAFSMLRSGKPVGFFPAGEHPADYPEGESAGHPDIFSWHQQQALQLAWPSQHTAAHSLPGARAFQEARQAAAGDCRRAGKCRAAGGVRQRLGSSGRLPAPGHIRPLRA